MSRSIGLMANGHVNASLPVFARPPPAVPAYSAPSTALATAPVAHVKLISDISDSRNVSNASARCLPQSLVIRQTENNTSSVPQPMIEKAAVEDEEDEDVEPSYPCGICHEEVLDDDEAILCERGCEVWFHRLCTGLTHKAYDLLTAENQAEWVCDSCINSSQIPYEMRQDT